MILKADPVGCVQGHGMRVCEEEEPAGSPCRVGVLFAEMDRDGRAWSAPHLVMSWNSSGSPLERPCIFIPSSDIIECG